jgi:hypothetical protein
MSERVSPFGALPKPINTSAYFLFWQRHVPVALDCGFRTFYNLLFGGSLS